MHLPPADAFLAVAAKHRVSGGDIRFCCLGTVLRGVPMVEPHRSHIVSRSPHLDPTHCRAICHEVGERLRPALDRDRSPLPSRLRGMLDRFDEMDVRARLQSSQRIN